MQVGALKRVPVWLLLRLHPYPWHATRGRHEVGAEERSQSGRADSASAQKFRGLARWGWPLP